MKAQALFTAALCLLALGGLAAAQDDEQAIRDIATQWQERYNQGDVQGVADFYAEDAWWSNFDGTVVEGQDAILQYLQSPDPVAVSDTMIEIATDDVAVAGDVAYANGSYALSGRDGSPIAQGSWLVVYERVDGEWLIARHAANAMLPEQGQAGAQ